MNNLSQQKSGKKALIFVITIIVILSTLLMAVFATEITSPTSGSTGQDDQVNVNIYQIPDVDIILTKSKTKADVSNFKTDLTNAIIDQGVMTSRRSEFWKIKNRNN